MTNQKECEFDARNVLVSQLAFEKNVLWEAINGTLTIWHDEIGIDIDIGSSFHIETVLMRLSRW